MNRIDSISPAGHAAMLQNIYSVQSPKLETFPRDNQAVATLLATEPNTPLSEHDEAIIRSLMKKEIDNALQYASDETMPTIMAWAYAYIAYWKDAGQTYTKSASSRVRHSISSTIHAQNPGMGGHSEQQPESHTRSEHDSTADNPEQET